MRVMEILSTLASCKKKRNKKQKTKNDNNKKIDRREKNETMSQRGKEDQAERERENTALIRKSEARIF